MAMPLLLLLLLLLRPARFRRYMRWGSSHLSVGSRQQTFLHTRPTTGGLKYRAN